MSCSKQVFPDFNWYQSACGRVNCIRSNSDLYVFFSPNPQKSGSIIECKIAQKTPNFKPRQNKIQYLVFVVIAAEMQLTLFILFFFTGEKKDPERIELMCIDKVVEHHWKWFGLTEPIGTDFFFQFISIKNSVLFL